MLSLMSNRMSQREKASDREQTVKKERIRREFQNEVDDEQLRQEMSHNNFVRQVAVSTDQRIRTTIASDPTSDQLAQIESECIRLADEVRHGKDQLQSDISRAETEIKEGNQKEISFIKDSIKATNQAKLSIKVSHYKATLAEEQLRLETV